MPRTNEEIARVTHRERTLSITDALARIDMENITEEFAEQGALALRWGVLAAQADADEGRAKDAITVIEAEVGNDLRASHTRLGEKFTVDSIKDEVTLHKRVRDAKEAYHVARENAGVLKAAKLNAERKDSKLDSYARGGIVGRDVRANMPAESAREFVRSRRGEIESAPSRLPRKPPRQSV